MTTPPLLDTNVLIYAFTDDPRARKAQSLMAEPFVISVQAVNEFANVARRKLKMNWLEIHQAVDAIAILAADIASLDIDTYRLAATLSERFQFSLFDALMIAAALRSGCDRLFSEDMQHGMQIDDRLVILNPFR